MLTYVLITLIGIRYGSNIQVAVTSEDGQKTGTYSYKCVMVVLNRMRKDTCTCGQT